MKPLVTLIFSLVALGAWSADGPYSLACEEALALSAMPAKLRNNATVYALRGERYEVTRRGDGNFTCIVERNHAESIVPQCVDRVGVASVLPAMIHRSERIVRGDQPSAVADAFAQQLAAGKFKAPSGAGINYMLSAYNYIYVRDADRLFRVGPHLMFYAPNVRNEDIGGSTQAERSENRGLPVVLDEGPHGYMVSFIEKPADGSDVEAACEGQLPQFESAMN